MLLHGSYCYFTLTLAIAMQPLLLNIVYTPCPKKRGHVIFNYNSRIPWSIFIIFIPLETGMNTPQLLVIYLLKIFMTS